MFCFILQNDLTSEAIDHYKIDHKDAFDAFKEHYVDSSGIGSYQTMPLAKTLNLVDEFVNPITNYAAPNLIFISLKNPRLKVGQLKVV